VAEGRSVTKHASPHLCHVPAAPESTTAGMECEPFGRSFDDFVSMFDLSARDLERPILHSRCGVASFAADARARGHDVVACDPLYWGTSAEILQAAHEVRRTGFAGRLDVQVHRGEDRWQPPEQNPQFRLASIKRFLGDYPFGRASGRYVPGGIPSLGFPDNAFGLALSSQFARSSQSTHEFHVAAAFELLRVAPEARFFPLVDQTGTSSSHLEQVMSALERCGHRIGLVVVDFDLQPGADRMLLVERHANATHPGRRDLP
jgi:hypothetical protein